jgi:hypothetical protein
VTTSRVIGAGGTPESVIHAQAWKGQFLSVGRPNDSCLNGVRPICICNGWKYGQIFLEELEEYQIRLHHCLQNARIPYFLAGFVAALEVIALHNFMVHLMEKLGIREVEYRTQNAEFRRRNGA